MVEFDVKVEKEGFEPQAKTISAIRETTKVFALMAKEFPEADLSSIPEEIRSVFLEALELARAGDLNGLFALLRRHLKFGSIMAAVSILGLISIILGLVTSAISARQFTKFLGEEVMQNMQFQLREAASTNNPELYAEARQNYQDTLKEVERISNRQLGAFTNIGRMALLYVKASRDALPIWDAAFEMKTAPLWNPNPGDVDAGVDAINSGRDPSRFVMSIPLSFARSEDVRNRKDALEAEFFNIKTLLDINAVEGAAAALDRFDIAINDFHTFILQNDLALIGAGVFEQLIKESEQFVFRAKTLRLALEDKGEVSPETTGILQVESNVPGSQVFIDGQFAGVTPFTSDLAIGSYALTIKAFGFEPEVTSVSIEADKPTKFTAQLESTQVLTSEEAASRLPLKITTTPVDGAGIFVNGTFQFIFTPGTVFLEPKDTIIRLDKDGYEPVEVRISAEDIEKGTLEVPLFFSAPTPDVPNAWEYSITGVNSETGEPLSAKIIINNFDVGLRTTSSVFLEPNSRYLLRLEAFGFEPGEVEIITGELP